MSEKDIEFNALAQAHLLLAEVPSFLPSCHDGKHTVECLLIQSAYVKGYESALTTVIGKLEGK